ncbi:FIG01388762: membrane lipoprotein [hydrothermal vent metagenome]|uniref:FIG01388762: membrane lipoprotein n=1 Tax=hydrothermal vent metagenome TaxID=652676 RepID=A0A1W1CBT2_9ZZZZ
MKYLKKLSDYAAVGGIGALLITGVTGCQQKADENMQEAQPQAKGAFVIIEEVSAGKYKIKDEFPAEETRIVLKKLDGSEKVLTKEELDALMKEENAKIDNGTSNLTKPQDAQVSSGGMGLGETILASVAGAMIGSWIGSKLFGNQNYQNNRKASYKSPSTYSKSKKSFSKSSRSRAKSGRSGFFGSKSSSSSSRRSSFGG